MTGLQISLSIMVIAGIVGGCANSLLGETDDAPSGPVQGEMGVKPQPWWSYIFLGVVASFLVPLFLSLVQSGLLTNMLIPEGPSPESALMFAGVCLVAAISSRAFIQTVSSRVIALAKQTSRSVAEVKGEQRTLQADVIELSENVGVLPDEPSSESEQDSQATMSFTYNQLSRDDLRILAAFESKPLMLRTKSGIASDASMPISKVEAILTGLKERTLVIEVLSEKTGRTLYKLTAHGREALKRESQSH
jgi:DNA-binding MarR family transcriptional regulator